MLSTSMFGPVGTQVKSRISPSDCYNELKNGTPVLLQMLERREEEMLTVWGGIIETRTGWILLQIRLKEI